MEQRMVPDDYVVMTIDIPDSVPVYSGSAMEAKAPAGMHPVWKARSAIISQENNVILFPEASRFEARIVAVEPFRFDPRLTGRILQQVWKPALSLERQS